jgi:UDP-GlcNAc:undecaprenyl-phosphate GlcNAc-1-phosphate transferase
VPFLIALGVGLVLTPASIVVGVRSGLVDLPSAVTAGRRGGPPALLKIHPRPVSQLGGVAVVVSTFIGLAVAGAWPAATVVIGVAAATVVGVVDDARQLAPLARAVALGAVGMVIAVGGASLEPLGVIGGTAAALAVFASANAVNLIDGQDGLAGGLAVIAALGVAGVAEITGSDPAFALALPGALLALLWWNREPARVFLGNGGAYGVGVLLAVAAVEASTTSLSALSGVVVSLGVFEAELALTVVRRVRAGGRLTEGDRDHSYDVLTRRLGSRRRSTRWFWIAGAVCSALGAVVALDPLVGAVAVAVVLVLAVPIIRRLLDRLEVRR